MGAQPAPPVTSQDAGAISREGERYYYGNGVAQDYVKAREWWEKAADKGAANAKTRLQQLQQLPWVPGPPP